MTHLSWPALILLAGAFMIVGFGVGAFVCFMHTTHPDHPLPPLK